MRTKHELILAADFDEIASYLIETDERPWYVPEKTKQYLIGLAGSTCAICKKYTDSPHIDHIIAVARGGKCFLSNLQVLCPTCNLEKSSHALDPRSYTEGYVIPIHMPSEHMISGWIWDKLYDERT